MSKLLGDTAGPNDGNVRAIISILLTLGFVAFCFATLLLYVSHSSDEALRTMLVSLGGSLGAAFSLAIGFYLGARTAQTSAGKGS